MIPELMDVRDTDQRLASYGTGTKQLPAFLSALKPFLR